MTEKKEEKKKTPPKAAAAQKAAAAAKPAAEKKPEAKPAPKAEAPKAKAAPKAKPQHSGATITVLQTGSPIGRQARQQQTLIGLGLNKRHRQRTLKDTPEVRGMIEKVKHLVKVVK